MPRRIRQRRRDRLGLAGPVHAVDEQQTTRLCGEPAQRPEAAVRTRVRALATARVRGEVDGRRDREPPGQPALPCSQPAGQVDQGVRIHRGLQPGEIIGGLHGPGTIPRVITSRHGRNRTFGGRS
ncbi:hypothetical protein WKI68_04425 [Streptomyces sp. MS1.HAVA.3]|uniref:Uncharacterized protein n=1 Tax=Streptomyces caledonius TaxID=3134107 RepID=A0ABU8TZ53_9ACTN